MALKYHLIKNNAALLASIALGLMVLITLFYTFSGWHEDWTLIKRTTTQAPGAASADKTTEIIAALPNLHLFGKWIAVGNDVPITNLELLVTGTVKGVGKDSKYNGEPSKVYISISGQPSKIYEEGDTLPSGVKIYDITPTMVILENNGQLEKLPLAREPLQFRSTETEEP